MRIRRQSAPDKHFSRALTWPPLTSSRPRSLVDPASIFRLPETCDWRDADPKRINPTEADAGLQGRPVRPRAVHAHLGAGQLVQARRRQERVALLRACAANACVRGAQLALQAVGGHS